MDRSPTRRHLITVLAGAVGLTSGCVESVSVPSELERAVGTPSPTAEPPMYKESRDVILEPASFPNEPDIEWEQRDRTRRKSQLLVSYDVMKEGRFSHSVYVSVITRLTVEGATFDHNNVVEQYTKEHEEAVVRELPFGDEATLVSFEAQEHVIAAYRSVFVHIYTFGGPREQVVELARRQINKLKREAPRDATPK